MSYFIVIFHFSKRLKRRWVIYLQHKIKDKSIILITISRKTKKELTYVAASNYYITKVLVFDWLYVNIFDSHIFLKKRWSVNDQPGFCFGEAKKIIKIAIFQFSEAKSHLFIAGITTYNSDEKGRFEYSYTYNFSQL